MWASRPTAASISVPARSACSSTTLPLHSQFRAALELCYLLEGRVRRLVSWTRRRDAIQRRLRDAQEGLNLFRLENLATLESNGKTSGRRSEKRIPTGKLFGFRKFDRIETSAGIGLYPIMIRIAFEQHTNLLIKLPFRMNPAI